MKLENLTILITGGSSGIGLEFVRQLEAKNRIINIGRPSPGLENFKAEHHNVLTFEADLSKEADVKEVANAITQKFDHIDLLINNAAIQFTPQFNHDDFEFSSISNEIITNLTTPIQLCALFLPHLLKSDKGIILNINSGLAIAPKTQSAVYCSTKAGLNIFSQALSYQLEHTSVKVLQAFLPLVDTAMTKGRGRGKISAEKAVLQILDGVANGKCEINVGKVSLLRLINRLSPKLARTIMKSA